MGSVVNIGHISTVALANELTRHSRKRYSRHAFLCVGGCGLGFLHIFLCVCFFLIQHPGKTVSIIIFHPGQTQPLL